jgi:hypothetical protein
VFIEVYLLSIHAQEHCGVKSEFGYFADGCFTDLPSPIHSTATGGRQFKKQHRVHNAEDGAINVAVDVVKKS